MRYGEEHSRSSDLSRRERVFCAGEVRNAPAWAWLQHDLLHGRVPVIDHMWQTETGGPVFGNPYSVAMLPIKPGSAGIPLAGIAVAVVDTGGQPLAPGEKAVMIVRRPFPGYSRSSETTSALTEAGSLLTGGALCGNMPLPQFDCT